MSWIGLKSILFVFLFRFLQVDGHYTRLEGPAVFHHQNIDQFNENLQKLLFGRSMYQSNVSRDNICCANGQWEANAYLNAGSTLSFGNTTIYVYYRGTGKIAFDEVNKKSYLSYNMTAFTPILPIHYRFKTTVIKDFAAGIMYEIDEHDKCSKESNRGGMEIVCIPESGKLISEGVFGNTNISTYQFSTFDELEEITTTSVFRNGSYCETVMLSYALFADDITDELVYEIDIVDLTPGVKDPSIFVPPKSCNDSSTLEQ